MGLLGSGGGGEFQTLNRPPANLPAPPQGRWLMTVRRDTPGGTHEEGRYLFSGPPAVIESFYSEALPRLGWRAAERGSSGHLRFWSPGRTCMIVISPAPVGRAEGEFRVVVLNMAQP
jgi:hypothetical protein